MEIEIVSGSTQLSPSVLNSFSAQQIPSYWRAVEFLSGNLASFPIEIQLNGAKNPDDHPLLKLFSRKANSETTSHVAFKTWFYHGEHYGNGFQYIRRDPQTAQPIGLYNLMPQDVTPFRLVPENGSLFDATTWYWHGPSHKPFPSAIVPQVVSSPITPITYNPFRAAYAKLGMKPESFGNTATAVIPVVSSTSGGLIPEGTLNTPNDAAPAVGVITLTAHGYQSKTYWYSNELVNSETWDVTTATLPALQGAREYGFAKAVVAAIKADSTTTFNTAITTATHNTITIDNLDDCIHSFTLPYDNNKALFLGQDTWNACEKLKDSNGRPIFEMFTVQDQSFVSYKGVPVFKFDSFDLLTTAGNFVGMCVSFTGFKLRDELEKLIKYIDQSNYVDMTGVNNVRYQGYGYVGLAVTKLLAGT